jgi:hypothetical protein
MNALDQARCYLKHCQHSLAIARGGEPNSFGIKVAGPPDQVRFAEFHFLMALNLAWEEQERERMRRGFPVILSDGTVGRRPYDHNYQGTINVGDTVHYPDGRTGKIIGQVLGLASDD